MNILAIIATLLLSLTGAPSAGLPACPTEDDETSICYWDPKDRGNGIGTSFISVYGATIPLG